MLKFGITEKLLYYCHVGLCRGATRPKEKKQDVGVHLTNCKNRNYALMCGSFFFALKPKKKWTFYKKLNGLSEKRNSGAGRIFGQDQIDDAIKFVQEENKKNNKQLTLF